jgi:hypothetical protein
MREGDFPHIQHHPAAFRVMIEKSSAKSYWILLDFDGKVGGSLHRSCTLIKGVTGCVALASLFNHLLKTIPTYTLVFF